MTRSKTRSKFNVKVQYKHSNEQQAHRLCLRPNCKEHHSARERDGKQ